MVTVEQLLEDIDDLKGQIQYAEEAINRGENIEMNTKLRDVCKKQLDRAEAQLDAVVDQLR